MAQLIVSIEDASMFDQIRQAISLFEVFWNSPWNSQRTYFILFVVHILRMTCINNGDGIIFYDVCKIPRVGIGHIQS